VFCSVYDLTNVGKIAIEAKGSTASIKHATISSGALAGTRLIGMPLLNRFGWPVTFEKLKTLGPFE